MPMDEKILRDVARWLSPADLRRARLTCKAWRSALGTLSTAATTPSEASTVTMWKVQLEAMVQALPCLQRLTIGSRLSPVGAQQLVVLAEAKQLWALHIPHAHSLQDRSLQALASMATSLKELKMSGAASLSSRSLLMLSVLGQLETLVLSHCGKISWYELQKAWQSACLAYEAQGCDTRVAPLPAGSSSASVYSKIGGWLPTAGLFRTASPGSGTVQAAFKHHQQQQHPQQPQQLLQQQQRAGPASIFSKMHGKGFLGGAVGNGRSSTGGSSHEGAVHKLLYRKLQTQLNTAGSRGPSCGEGPREVEAWVCGTVTEGAEGTEESATDTSAEVEALAKTDAAAASANRQADTAVSGTMQTPAQLGANDTGQGAAATNQPAAKQPSVPALPPAAIAAAATTGPQQQRWLTDRSASTSALSRVGSLVRQGTTAAAAALSLSSGSSITRQSSTVQSALLAYLNDDPTGSRQTGRHTISSSSGGGARNGSSRVCRDGRPLPAMPFTKLTMLSFTCSESTFKNPGPELAAVAALTTLTQLEMTKCKLPDAAFGHLTCLTRLSKLKLSGLWLMGDAGLAKIAEIVSLSSLALSEAMHVTAHGLMTLSRLTALTSLALGLAQDLGSGSIAPAANSLELLRCLEVNAPCWDDVDCHLLAASDGAQLARGDASHGSSSIAASSDVSMAAAGLGTSAPSSLSIQRQQQLAAPIMLWQLIGRLEDPTGNSNVDKEGPAHSQSSSCSNSCIASARSPASRACSFSSLNSFGSFSTWSGTDAATRLAAVAVPSQKQRLQVLKLHGCRMMTHRGLEAISRLSELHMFVVDNCREVHTAEVISQDLIPPKVSTLALRHTAFGNAFSGCIGLPACAGTLTKLELTSQNDVQVGQMRRVLSFFPQLQALDLSGCQELGESLLCHLPLLPKLQQLSLSGTRITGEAFDQLVHLQELQVLQCKGCNLLTDPGLVPLCRLLGLQELDVSHCSGLSDKGLLAVMLNAAGLIRLDVRGCRLLTRDVVRRCPYYLKLLHSL